MDLESLTYLVGLITQDIKRMENASTYSPAHIKPMVDKAKALRVYIQQAIDRIPNTDECTFGSDHIA